MIIIINNGNNTCNNDYNENENIVMMMIKLCNETNLDNNKINEIDDICFKFATVKLKI